MAYNIRQAAEQMKLNCQWDGPHWGSIEALTIANYRPEGSSHRPLTQLKLQHRDDHLYGLFKVNDQYVRCVRSGYQQPVCRDSCVECFIKPKEDNDGYFNFEMNCGGALLCFFVEDPTRIDKGLKSYQTLTSEQLDTVEICHTMPKIVDPEIEEPTEWLVAFKIPFELLEAYVGPLGEVAGQQWQANFYKCGDETSHPHWVSWQPVDELNFHLPKCFGAVKFE